LCPLNDQFSRPCCPVQNGVITLRSNSAASAGTAATPSHRQLAEIAEWNVRSPRYHFPLGTAIWDQELERPPHLRPTTTFAVDETYVEVAKGKQKVFCTDVRSQGKTLDFRFTGSGAMPAKRFFRKALEGSSEPRGLI